MFCVLLPGFDTPSAAGDHKRLLSPREQRLVGVWKPEPGQRAVAFQEFVFRADGTGTFMLHENLKQDCEWDLRDDRLILVHRDDLRTQGVPVTAVTRSFLVIHEDELYYRKQVNKTPAKGSENSHATNGDERQTAGVAGRSFGLVNAFSGKLSAEQKRLVPEKLRNAFLIESLQEITASSLAKELEHKTPLAEETRDGERYVALKDYRHVQVSDDVSGQLIIIERYLVTDDDPYEAAMIAALHEFAADGEIDHLDAILEKHPELVNARRRFPEPHKPLRTSGFAPLHHAAENSHDKVALRLLKQGADVNQADGMGWTPLHLAALRGHLSGVKLLAKRGAHVDAKTVAVPESFGVPPGSSDDAKPQKLSAVPSRTPLDLARKAQHAEVVQFLKFVGK